MTASENMEPAGFHPFASGTGGVFSGVGDNEVESHFTFERDRGFHLSTYLNLEKLSGLGDGKEKTKFEQDDLGFGQ